jgi:hypothetical protein
MNPNLLDYIFLVNHQLWGNQHGSIEWVHGGKIEIYEITSEGVFNAWYESIHKEGFWISDCADVVRKTRDETVNLACAWAESKGESIEHRETF